jgi:tetratricopeptide (TPR) repeat protein
MQKRIAPKRQKILFWIILVSLPIITLFLLESGLRIFEYGDNLDLFLQGKEQYSDYMYINRWVAKRYFTSESIPDPTNDVFLRKKPENGYRIFVLGGSTAAGWPYTNNLIFSRILQKRLSDAFPDNYIEVVNTSISAINSYTLADFTDEIIDAEPDLIIIYAGHNEYYGALGVGSTQNIGNYIWIKKLYLGLIKYKTFQLIRNFIQYSTRLFGSDPKSDSDMSATLMERLVSEQNIEYGGDLYQMGIKQFEENLDDILSDYENSGIPVILSELISNISDQPPFKSIINSQSESASLIYTKAKKLQWDRKYTEAKDLFLKAKDLDALRFRASEEFNDIIHKSASQHDMIVAKMKRFFEKYSEHALVGNNIILDHLHPNIDGHFLMADVFYHEIVNTNLIGDKQDIVYKKSSTEYRKEWGYSVLDSIYADMRIKYLKSGWPFLEKARNTYFKENPPNSMIEKIAFQIWKDRSYTSEDGHADLANYYESNGYYERAFHEYNALTCLKPLNSTAYLMAADMSIKAGNMPRALPYLEKSLKLEETAFAYKWIGLIHLKNHDYEKAISNLETVYDLDIEDVELYFNLGMAYFQTGKYDLAIKMLNDLKAVKTTNPQVTGMINRLSKLIQSKNQNSPVGESAIQRDPKSKI